MRESVNDEAEVQTTARQGRTSFGGMPKSSWAPPKGMRGKCERRGGNINADGAGAEVFVDDGCSQGASFVPMAAISRRWRGGRIYNNTRTREPLRRKCVKPADLTTHSPPKAVARPNTATRTTRALPLPHAAPTYAPRSADAFPSQRQCTPADLTTHFPSKTCSRLRSDAPCPSTSAPPRSADAHPQAARCIPRRPHNTFPFAAPSPAPAQRHALPAALSHALPAPTPARRQRDAFLADLTTHSPPKTFARPRTATRSSRALPLAHAAPTHARRLRDAFPATLTTHSPQRHAASPSVPLRTQKNGTAQCMCDAECLGRPSLRSVIWVGEPRAVRRRCGALACRRGA